MKAKEKSIVCVDILCLIWGNQCLHCDRKSTKTTGLISRASSRVKHSVGLTSSVYISSCRPGI